MSAEITSGEPTTRATLAEVAALADVSISTVSKVLNGRSGVSEDTRARIEALLQDHQYNRRSPGPNHAPLIEVLCFEIASSWAAEAIAGIERLAREHGVGVVVSGTNDRQKPDLDWIEGVLNRRPVGVILVACNLLDAQQRQLRSRTFPLSCWIPPSNRLQTYRQSAPRTGAARTPLRGTLSSSVIVRSQSSAARKT